MISRSMYSRNGFSMYIHTRNIIRLSHSFSSFHGGFICCVSACVCHCGRDVGVAPFCWLNLKFEYLASLLVFLSIFQSAFSS